jgi:hypothetical protein
MENEVGIMSGRVRVSWSDHVKAELLQTLYGSLKSSLGENEQVLQILTETLDSFVPHRDTQTRLYQVLEAHRTIKSDDRVLSNRTINLAQRIATQLPGEKFWLISAKDDGSIVFESDVAKVNVLAYE